MDERYTDGAWQVILSAQREAVALKQPYIGTEHILIGLLHDGDCPAARVLESYGITLELARRLVLDYVPAGEELLDSAIPLTPRSERVLEHALREALARGHSAIGSEHILLGLLHEPRGLAATVIFAVADVYSVRDDAMDLLGEASESAVAALLATWHATNRERRLAHRTAHPERAQELVEREHALKKQVRAEVAPRHNRLLDDLHGRLGLAKR